MAKRPDLQGMRAVAVLAVFADHLFAWPSGGFVGVDMFFVLSGFFITGLLLKERSTTGGLSFQNFYVRRVKRILPSALLVLAVTVVGGYLLFPAVRARETLIDALWAALFGANFRFQAVGADYFQQGQPPSPIQHYWSLSIEEQFYFVWPVLLLLLFGVTRKLYRRGRLWARHWGLFAGMGVIVAGSFAWAMHLSVADPNAAYFSTFTRVWELGVGALLAIAGPWLARIPTAARPVLAYLGLAGVVASLLLIDSTVQFPAPWAALPVLSTALVVASFHGGTVRGVPILTNPVARYIGDTSYTMYLWHWPVIILLEAALPRTATFYTIAVALTVALTALTFRFYEDPIRKSNWLLDKRNRAGKKPRISQRRWGVVGSGAAVVILFTLLTLQYNDRMTAIRERAAVEAEQSGDVSPSSAPIAAQADPCFGAPAMVTPGCALWNPDAPLRPSVDSYIKDTDAESARCFRHKDEKLKACTFGYRGPDAIRIALVGDSHAGQLIGPLLSVLNENKWQLTTYAGISCAWMSPAPDCDGGDIVGPALLSNRFDLVLTAASREDGSVKAYERAWTPVAAAGSRIAVLVDGPIASEDSLNCLTRVTGSVGDCGTPADEAFSIPDPQVTASKLVPGTTLIDLTPFYCSSNNCPSVIGNVIVHRDSHGHMTQTYLQTLAQPLAESIRQTLAQP
ncbi:acyltransferase family protein [Mycobacterium sp. C3-094]